MCGQGFISQAPVLLLFCIDWYCVERGEKYRGQELEIIEERLETITEVCREVHGEEFASRCLARINENGYINRAQRDFGLECRADSMLEGNETYLGLVEEFGFDWFEVEVEEDEVEVKVEGLPEE